MSIDPSVKRRLQVSLWVSGSLLAVACWVPLLAVILPRPETQPLEIWFQRSGSVMTVCALLAAHLISEARASITPTGFGSVGINELRVIFIPKHNRFEVLSFVLVLLGTLIWGYGDLLLP